MSTLPINPAQIQSLLNHLKSNLSPQQILDDEAQCWPYGYDNSRNHCKPLAVVFPNEHHQVQVILKLCNKFRVPVVARGRGTGTTGGSVPLYGGIVISMERMNKILTIDTANRAMVVEAGVLNQTVQDEAGKHGFFWPPDPTSAAYCTVGGNLAYNSAGPRAVKYGTPRENVLGLRAITGSGEDLTCGTYTTKGVVGYDLTRLLIGSEGTLAIMTEMTLKLTPIAQAKATIRTQYSDIHEAAKAVSRIMSQATIPYALEFMDRQSLDNIRQHTEIQIDRRAEAVLIIEVDGQRYSLQQQMDAICVAAKCDQLLDIQFSQTESEIQSLWAIRKALSPALRATAAYKINEDVVVPVSYMAELIEGLDKISNKFQIPIVNFGHAGNGNIHVNLLLQTAEELKNDQTRQCLDAVFDLVLSLKGTLSGEHGVGIEKRDYVALELDPTSIQLMRRIKSLFDPLAILNPGKMLPLLD